MLYNLIAVGLWITEAVPAFAVGLLIMGYLVFALGTTLIHPEPWDVTPYLNTWASPIIWLMLGGFFMAEGLSRTGLDRQLFALAIRPAILLFDDVEELVSKLASGSLPAAAELEP